MQVVARVLSLLVVLGLLLASELPEGVVVQGPQRDESKGIDVYMVSSPYTGAVNRVEVLLPDPLPERPICPVLYVLPVGGDFGGKYGDQLQVVRATGLHDRHGLICVSMQFDTMPWYGAHVSEVSIRHEDYIIKVILPLIEQRYPAAAQADKRLLLGFSKSGYGAVSLLLRNLQVFGAACSWDAPLAFTRQDYGKVGTRKHFGSEEQMAQYLPMVLAEQQAGQLRGGRARLCITGSRIWGRHTKAFAAHLKALGIPHRYDNSLTMEHDWVSGWVPAALAPFLAEQLGR